MNGDGSQDHPWEVTNLADLRSLVSVAQAGQYAKLIADIDCNEQCPGGWTTVTLNQHLDLNGHNIIAPMILNDNCLFLANQGIAIYTISNGGILNVFEEFQSKSGIFNCYLHRQSAGGSYITDINARYKLENLGMSMYIRNDVLFFSKPNSSSQTRNDVTANKCTIKIMGNLKNCSSPFLGQMSLTNNRIICDYISDGNHYLCTPGSDVRDIENCRFEGKVTGVFNLNDANTEGSYNAVNNGHMINSIILTESTQSANYHTVSYTGKSIISNKCNTISGNPNYNYVIKMDDDDIKSYSAVNNAGFITIEV